MDTLIAILADIGKQHREVEGCLKVLKAEAELALSLLWGEEGYTPLPAMMKILDSSVPRMRTILTRLSQSEA